MVDVTTREVKSRAGRLRGLLRESIAGSDRDFTRGNLGPAILILALPMVLEMVGESVFAVCDAFFVARLGPEALAAVGLTESLLEIVYAVAVGLAMATTAMVSRRFGEGNAHGAAVAGVQAIYVGVVFAAVVGALGVVYAEDLLRLMGADAATVRIGTAYTRWIFGGMVTIMLLFVINGIFRGAGDASTAMRALWIANGINLVLDPCLIFGLGPFPELGLQGAGVATTIGRGTGVVYQLVMLASRHGRIRVAAADLRFLPAVAGRLLQLSLGGIGQLLIATASYIALIRILATFGSTVLAGYVLAIRVVIFVILPSWGFSNAAATLVGQNLGAKQPQRAARSVWLTGYWNMGFMLLVTGIFTVFAPEVIGVFTDDPAVAIVGIEALRIISLGYPLYAWGMVMMQAFNGAGDTATPTWINFVCFWCFEIPMAWGLSHALGYGPPGVFWAIATAYSLSAVVGIWWFRRGRWQHKQV